MVLAPDPVQRKLYAEAIEPNLVDGDALFFGHGLNIRYDLITPPAGVDVVHGRAEGPGPPGPPAVRRRPRRAVLVAVEQDATGNAWDLVLSYAKGIGGTRAGAHQDDVHRGDRDRPVRRAGRALRRRSPS